MSESIEVVAERLAALLTGASTSLSDARPGSLIEFDGDLAVRPLLRGEAPTDVWAVDGGQALVPAWLFEVKGWTAPLPVVAVQKQYLPSPEEPTADPGTPGAVPPAPPATEPAPAREAFAFDKASRGDAPDQLVVTYGDSSSCVHENVTAQAKEDAETVYVILEADTRDPDVACTEDYRPVERTIRLQAALGDRKVVDASTGKQVPVT